MPGKRPINADLPAVADETPTPPDPSSRPSEIDHTSGGSKSEAHGRRPRRQPDRRRRPVPAALKGIAGLVIVAVVFLVAAVLGGGGSHRGGAGSTARPIAPVETPSPEAVEEIGYPSFATNNTTRIGGADPASIAAAVALAVYPSRTTAQRPAAVTLVDESDWQGAVAGAVLMAAPVRAPLLVSSGGDLPDVTSQALEALAPQGSPGSGRAQAFAIGAAASPEGLRTTAIGGAGPAAVAARIEAVRDRLLKNGPPDHVVLAPGDAPQFAMPAAAWAARSGDPVLFTGADKLPAATVAALESHPRTPVYVLGPPTAISSAVLQEVARIDPQVRRVSGENAVENAIALARYADDGFGWNVNDPGHGFVVARDDEPLAAALAAPLSASGTWGPLLLTDDADTLPEALREYLLGVKPGYTTDPTRAFYNHVWVIGDEEAISVNQQAEIDQLAELAKIGKE